MSKLLISAAVSLGLASLNSVQAAKSPEQSEQKVAESAPKTLDRDEKNREAKARRAQKVLDVCEKSLAEAETEAKSLSGIDKKMADLFVGHAKLEMEAAKDPEMTEHRMHHARRCKYYVSKAIKTEKQNKSAKVAAETKDGSAKS